jgi:DNA mismatch repair protein MutS2
VLLDELGAATDPAEGSALARAILVFLLSRRTLAVTTSHYDDLKAFAHSTKGLKNASLDLDPVTRMPTYHLTVGVPGGSNALAVAQHLGLPEPIIQDARQMLGKGTQELDSLLSDLGKERAVVSKLRTELDEERRAMKVKEDELEQRAQQVRADERRAIERTRDVVVREAADLQRDIRAALSDLRKTRTKETVEHARQALASVQQTLRSDTWSPPPAEEAQNDLTIKPGDTVLVRDSNVKATVLSILAGAGQAEIQAGRARMTIGLSGLDKVMTDPKLGAPRVFPITKQVSTEPLSLQIDLRGKRADEVEIALDNYLNAASLSGLSEVRIIHGMATGTVRKIVRDFLSTHPLVRSYRAGDRGEGGDGATVAKL